MKTIPINTCVLKVSDAQSVRVRHIINVTLNVKLRRLIFFEANGAERRRAAVAEQPRGARLTGRRAPARAACAACARPLRDDAADAEHDLLVHWLQPQRAPELDRLG